MSSTLRAQNFRFIIPLFLFALISTACQPKPASPKAPPTLVVRTWEDDMPADLFDDFTAQTGIPVRFEPYESQEDAAAEIATGSPADILVVDGRLIPGMIQDNLLHTIDRSNVPNFRYISAGFRSLSFDPNNHYSIPYQWGTSGVVYRRDLTGREVTHWGDLWDPAYQGKVGLWEGQPREVIGLTLKMLGYSANSEDPAELAAAMQKLAELQSGLVWIEAIDPYTVVPGLLDGRVVIAMGYANDEVEGKAQNPEIHYILPQEGTVLWSEHFTIPVTTQHPAEAERLLNYLLEPEVMAAITSYNNFAVAHDGALPLIPQELRDDPLVFPPNELIANAEIILALSPEAEQRYMAAWEAFVAAVEGSSP